MPNSLLERFFPRRPEMSFPQNLDISTRAKQELTRLLPQETIEYLMKELCPLPDMYRQPEKRLAFLLQQPVMKMTVGYQLDPFVPITTYIPIDTKEVPAINAGECGQIARTFLTKLMNPTIATAMTKASLTLSHQVGTSPAFFASKGDRHVWIELQSSKKNFGVLIDPSFGTIRQRGESHGYTAVHEQPVPWDKDSLQKAPYHQYAGWEHDLIPGRHCTSDMARDTGQNIVLGLSPDSTYAFSLGFETQRDLPFVTVSYPHDQRKELYWKEPGIKFTDGISVMSTHSHQDIALRKPQMRDLIRTLVETTGHARYEDVTLSDLRLRGMLFLRG